MNSMMSLQSGCASSTSGRRACASL
jgi:hypothetical protein